MCWGVHSHLFQKIKEFYKMNTKEALLSALKIECKDITAKFVWFIMYSWDAQNKSEAKVKEFWINLEANKVSNYIVHEGTVTFTVNWWVFLPEL